MVVECVGGVGGWGGDGGGVCGVGGGGGDGGGVGWREFPLCSKSLRACNLLNRL